MEAENSNVNHIPSVLHQLLPVVGPALLISVGYVDPGKWAANVEGGARFGFDLVTPMLVFNFAAILCHYLSARIGVVTGRDLAQICSDEYDKCTCVFLGVQTELSMILLDLTMVLGIAHGLNVLFGWDLFTCVFLTAVNAVLFPLCTTLLENCKAKFLCICIAGFVLFSFVLGVIISQPEVPLSMNGMLTKLSGESAFALMSILGASIMPHNFYLHSSIVQQHHGPPNISKDALCHNHFFAILCIFSGIFLVNYVLMNSAANLFYSTGLVLLTFQDAMSLMEQVFRGPVAPFVFLLVLLVSNQITALTWSTGGQVVLHDFLKLDIPGWLHCATIRIIAIIPALYCVWSSGAEGLYQLLIFTQALVAVLLPSSVIPLFRIAASKSIMGIYKTSQIVEFLAIITFIGMLGLKIVFVIEMMFGNSDWVSNLRWNMGSSFSISYLILLVTVCASFCLMLWLAATPLKSASVNLDAQVWNLDIRKVSDASSKKEDNDIIDTRYHGDAHVEKQEASPIIGKGMDGNSDKTVTNFDIDLPETIMEPDYDFEHTITENSSNSSSIGHREESTMTVETTSVSTVVTEASDIPLMDVGTVKVESMDPVEKTLGIEDLQVEKDDDDDDEPEESTKGGLESTPSLTPEGPGSFRSLSGKSEEGGNGAGSLSRLAGLGRAARRQLAAILEEFWGQLYDFHGQATPEAKVKKLDVLLGIDSKSSSLKVDTNAKEISGYFPSVGGKGADPLSSSSLYDSPTQPRGPSTLEPYDQRSSSIWSNHLPMLNTYVQNSNCCNVLDAGEKRYSSMRTLPSSEGGEKRYSSMRTLPSSEGWDYQPATVHGYQMASYLSRVSRTRGSENLNGQLESPAFKTSALSGTNYGDTVALSMVRKLQNGLSTSQTPSFQNLGVSRTSQLTSDRSYYPLCPSGAAENLVSSANTKKYHSSPDIHRDHSVYNRSAQWESPSGFGSSISSIGRNSYERFLYSNESNSRTRTGTPLAFDELSPSNAYRGALSSPMSSSYDTGSFWSTPPFEQFGVADSSRAVGNAGAGSRTSSVSQETSSTADSEARLLQSFRYCILKLLKLEGSDWLFRHNDGADEDLIDRVAAREKLLYEAETREMNRGISAMKNNDAAFTHFMVSSVPHCGEGCVWRSDLIISFGVWCIHRILDLSLMESRPELWGKYTYVLNRLQGIIDLAFSKPHSPMTPCFCLQITAAQQQRLSPPVANGMLPPAAKPGRGKCTNAVTLLDIIKDVEIAISCRKGRTGTAAGDVAFPKGKENLASVLKRYKRRLSNKPVGSTLEGPGSRKVSTSAPFGS